MMAKADTSVRPSTWAILLAKRNLPAAKSANCQQARSSLWFLFLILVLCSFPARFVGNPSSPATGEYQIEYPRSTDQKPSTDQKGTNETPFVVKVVPSPKTDEEAAREADERKQKFFVETETVITNQRLLLVTKFLAVIAFLQLCVYIYQSWRLTQSVNSMTDQSKTMQRHIDEAAWQAKAMEDIAINIEISAKAATESVKALKTRTAQQMRAYLSIDTGDAVWQDRGAGILFGGRPLLTNYGHTPAHRVSVKIRAGIFSNPLPADFIFHSAYGREESYDMGPSQKMFMPVSVDSFCDDADIERIKCSDGLALYFWGIVTYWDAFDERHDTNFGYYITWLPKGGFVGTFLAGMNSSD